MNIIKGQMLQNSTMRCEWRRITVFLNIDPEEDGKSSSNNDPISEAFEQRCEPTSVVRVVAVARDAAGNFDKMEERNVCHRSHPSWPTDSWQHAPPLLEIITPRPSKIALTYQARLQNYSPEVLTLSEDATATSVGSVVHWPAETSRRSRRSWELLVHSLEHCGTWPSWDDHVQWATIVNSMDCRKHRPVTDEDAHEYNEDGSELIRGSTNGDGKRRNSFDTTSVQCESIVKYGVGIPMHTCRQRRDRRSDCEAPQADVSNEENRVHWRQFDRIHRWFDSEQTRSCITERHEGCSTVFSSRAQRMHLRWRQARRRDTWSLPWWKENMLRRRESLSIESRQLVPDFTRRPTWAKIRGQLFRSMAPWRWSSSASVFRAVNRDSWRNPRWFRHE